MMRERLTARFSADDWGLSPGVNAAILELARAGMLRSVSLFANLPYLDHGLRDLERTGVELAAHLNFTLGRPLSAVCPTLTGKRGEFRPFGSFLARGLFGLTPAREVRMEAEAQLATLFARCAVSSVNGHQNVHLLPWMVAPIASAARAFGVRKVRLLDDPAHRASRFATAWSEGSYARAWPEAEIELAHYLWPTGRWEPGSLARKLDEAGHRALLLHPSASDDFDTIEFRDGLTADRVREYEKLRGLA